MDSENSLETVIIRARKVACQIEPDLEAFMGGDPVELTEEEMIECCPAGKAFTIIGDCES